MRQWLMVLRCRQPSWVGTQAHRSRMYYWWTWHPCLLALRQLVVSWRRSWSATHAYRASRHRPSQHILTTNQQSPFRSTEHRPLDPYGKANISKNDMSPAIYCDNINLRASYCPTAGNHLCSWDQFSVDTVLHINITAHSLHSPLLSTSL
jgi:hypothetical protein